MNQAFETSVRTYSANMTLGPLNFMRLPVDVCALQSFVVVVSPPGSVLLKIRMHTEMTGLDQPRMTDLPCSTLSSAINVCCDILKL